MRDGQLFAAVCKHCGRHLLTAPLFTAPEIATIRKHVVPCAHDQRISASSLLGEVLVHIWVTAVAE